MKKFRIVLEGTVSDEAEQAYPHLVTPSALRDYVLRNAVTAMRQGNLPQPLDNPSESDLMLIGFEITIR